MGIRYQRQDVPPEVKKRAIERYCQSCEPIRNIASMYGVSTKTLQRWAKEAGKARSAPAGAGA